MFDFDILEHHQAHMLAVRAAGKRRRIVTRMQDFDDCAVLYPVHFVACARSLNCNVCKRALDEWLLGAGRAPMPYVELGLIHSPVEMIEVPRDPLAAAQPIPQVVTP